MDWSLGLTDVAIIKSAGPVGSANTAIYTNTIRVFDIAIGDTGSAAGRVLLLDNYASSTSSRVALIDSRSMFLHSNAGYRFTNGCYCIATGCTATINYIREF